MFPAATAGQATLGTFGAWTTGCRFRGAGTTVEVDSTEVQAVPDPSVEKLAPNWHQDDPKKNDLQRFHCKSLISLLNFGGP